jgi:hypothetical protein
MSLFQQLIEARSFFRQHQADPHFAQALRFGRDGLLGQALGLPKAKTNVYSLSDKIISLRGLPHPDKRTPGDW